MVELVHAVTGKPVPVKCKVAGTCSKVRCLLKYWHNRQCESYVRGEVQLKLLRLKLTYFKGAKSLDINANGKNVSIYGDNEKGKTTVFDAVVWLLFGKDSLNRNDFNIKTLDSDGKAIPEIDHEVEAVFDINGTELILRRVYKEVYSKKRGNAKAELTGHTTDFYVNEVPVKKSEYEARIKAIAPEDLFKLLTNPLYFNEQMKWEERRNILFQICGEVSDIDVIRSNGKLLPLEKVLESRTIDEHRKVINEKRKKINEKINLIPVRIDEVTKGKPDVDGMNFDEISKKIVLLQEQLEKAIEKLQMIKSGNGSAERQKQILEIDTEIIKLKNEFSRKQNERVTTIRSDISDLKLRLSEFEQFKNAMSRKIADLKSKIENDDAKCTQLRSEWTELNSTTYKGDNICPTCNQDFPEPMVEELKAKFNNLKAEKLAKINGDGKSLKTTIEENQKKASDLDAALQENEAAAKEIINKIEALTQSINIIMTAAAPVEINELEQKKKTLLEVTEDDPEETKLLNSTIESLKNSIRTLESQLAKKDQLEADNKRIDELKDQQRTLSAEYEKLEEAMFLIEEFTKAKVSMLDERINTKFENARFKLFEEQVNGGIQPCCVTTYKGVPYTDLNNAARINVGLEIISVLGKHYNFNAPIIVDNAESVTRLYEPNAQLIRLVVSEQDQKLRVEVDGDKEGLK